MLRIGLRSLLVCSFALGPVACRGPIAYDSSGGTDEGTDESTGDGTGESTDTGLVSACEEVEAVAASWMNWKTAVDLFGHHYRYVRSTAVFGADPGEVCMYTTTIEVDADNILMREVTVSSFGDVCDAEWTETGEQIGSHDDAWAAPALTLEALYEDCCVTVMPDADHFDADNLVSSYSLFSYCGDDDCDDGGCVRVDSISFLP